MNNVITTNNGGFPVVLDDLRFNQQAVRDAFYGLLSAFGVSAADSFIISGCVIASYSIGGAYSAGWISLNGEILQVDAGVLPSPGVGEDWYWAADVTYDAAGAKVMENATTVQAYQVRKGKIISSTAGLPATLLTPTLSDKIKGIMLGEDWIDVASSTAKYRKDKLGFVHLIGMIGQNNISTFTLPVGYRPATNQSFRAFWIDNPVASYNNITISTAGVVTASALTGAGTDREVGLQGISFRHV